MKNLTELKNKYSGHDIYVLGSGPSLNFIDPNFFVNKITISTNYVYQTIPCWYAVFKENAPAQRPENTKIIVSKHSYGGRGKLNEGDYYFEHTWNMKDQVMLPGNDDEIVASWSTITSAIHIAAYMGARHIILCGHDCGTIDGIGRYEKYYSQYNDFEWFKKIEQQTIEVKKYIKNKYGCDVYSLNPFINFGLEGHKYNGT